MVNIRRIFTCIITFWAMNILINAKQPSQPNMRRTIGIIIGSTRDGRTAEKIYHAFVQLIAKQYPNTVHRVIKKLDLLDYDLPIMYESTPPVQRTSFSDEKTKRWSDEVQMCDAFIVIVPEYNGSFPGVLKNALDILYKEWNNKPVAFVGYSGGPSGGLHAIEHLKSVAKALQMKPFDVHVAIPSVWKLFNEKNVITDEHICTELTAFFDKFSAALEPFCSSKQMPTLYKIVSPAQLAKENKTISLADEDAACIHFSTQEQLPNILKKYWAHKPAVVLTIDTGKLNTGLLVHESNKKGGDAYYHLYNGEINTDAIRDQRTIQQSIPA